MPDHITYMKRCLALAARGLGRVAPNPMVGCIIVKDDQILAEGWHQLYGGPHAEVNAIHHVTDKSLLSEATVYVNLEPCAHHGKTPPCADLLVHHKVKEVVIGCTDTNPLVAGKGIEKLKAGGIAVIQGVLENECRELNKRFFTYFEKKRPYVILKWAQTQDGFISLRPPFSREQNWITAEEGKKLVHQWRAEEQAIMIGTNTALLDNPQLTVRLVEGENPLRVVIDEKLVIPYNSHVFSDDNHTLVFTAMKAENKGNVQYCKTDFSKNILPFLLQELYQRKINSVMVEGGAFLLQSFIDQGLWDEARVFTGAKKFGDGLIAPQIKGEEMLRQMKGPDELRVLENRQARN